MPNRPLITDAQSVPNIAQVQDALQRLALQPCRIIGRPESGATAAGACEVLVDFGLNCEPLASLSASEWLDTYRDPEGAEQLIQALRILAQRVRRPWQIATTPMPM
ncbi:MAG: hypothetical protein PHP86_10225 [Nevskiales bacterium]|nr:hypothetical protein [Nevskiales bacterium]